MPNSKKTRSKPARKRKTLLSAESRSKAKRAPAAVKPARRRAKPAAVAKAPRRAAKPARASAKIARPAAKPARVRAKAVAKAARRTASTRRWQTQRWRIVLDNVSQGVAFFDGDARLILCNRPYAEIYRLSPDQLKPGMTLGEIAELRVRVGACPMGADDYLAYCRAVTAKREKRTWSVTLGDGRIIRIRHQATPDGGWASTHEDITDLQEKRLLIEEKISMQRLIDMAPDNLWVKDADSRFVVANLATARRLGRATPEELIGRSDRELCPWETAQKYLADENRVLTTGEAMIDSEEYVLAPDGGKLWLSTTKTALRNEAGEVVGVIGVSRDISARRRAEALREGEAEILEMIAVGAPTEYVLEQLVHLIESQSSGVFGSVLLLSDDGLSLRCCAAPSLPAQYAEAADGLRVGPDVACSGSAAYRRELVVSADIASDPRWTDLRDSAAALGFKSCWSAPILSKGGDALGAFAMYATSAHEPTEAERQLTYVATRLAGIAIERERADRRPRAAAAGAGAPA
jgi:PAS domain S-box-containing protein